MNITSTTMEEKNMPPKLLLTLGFALLALALSSCAVNKGVQLGPDQDELRSSLTQTSPELRASALESLLPKAKAPALRRDLLSAIAYSHLQSQIDRQGFIRASEAMRREIRNMPLHKLFGEEIVIAYLGLVASGMNTTQAARSVPAISVVASQIYSLCGDPTWHPTEGSFRQRTRIAYNRALQGSCLAWIRGGTSMAMTKIAQAAKREMALMNMGENDDASPVPGWVSGLGAKRVDYAPFAIFADRLDAEAHIRLGGSITRLQQHSGEF